MEFVQGASLTDVIEVNKNMTENQIAYICRRVTEGLAYLHANGVIHRDIKSDNSNFQYHAFLNVYVVLMSLQGEVKISKCKYSFM